MGFGKKVIDFTRQIIKGRDQLAANSQKKLDKWGDYEIEGVKIVRKPIMEGIVKLANKLTKGEFKKDMLKNYDDLFHLRVDIKLKGGVCLTIEKNETVEISRGKCENLNEDGLEAMDIEVKKPRTLKEAYERMTKGYPTAKNLYDYDSVGNNCQRFVDTFLSKNNDAFNYTAEDRKFVKQDVKFIIEKYNKLRKGAKVITNLAQRLSLFMTGGGTEIGDECGICLEKTEQKEDIINCGVGKPPHLFHRDCLIPLVKKPKMDRPKCPECRGELSQKTRRELIFAYFRTIKEEEEKKQPETFIKEVMDDFFYDGFIKKIFKVFNNKAFIALIKTANYVIDNGNVNERKRGTDYLKKIVNSYDEYYEKKRNNSNMSGSGMSLNDMILSNDFKY